MINLRRSAVALMAASIVGYALSFGKEVVVAWLFGAGKEMDAYYAALTLPSFIASMLGFAATAVLVPAYVGWKVEKPGLAPALARLTLRDVPIALTALAALMAAAAGPLMRILFPGLPPEVSARAAQLERLMAFGGVSLGTVALLTGFLNAEGAFAGPSLSSAFVTFSTLGAIALLWRHGVASLAVGLVAGTLLQALWLAWRWRRIRTKGGDAALSWSSPELRSMVPFLFAMIATNGLAETNTLVDRFMASLLPSGSVASFGYAVKLFSVPNQILAMPVIAVAYPLLAHRLAQRDEAALAADFKKACRLGYAVLLPAAAFLVRFAGAIVVVLFERGRFDPQATRFVARTLTCLSLGLPFMVPISLVGRLAVIERDSKVLLKLGALAVILNAVTDWLFMQVFNPPVAGIAFSTSATLWIVLAVYAAVLRRQHRWLGWDAIVGGALPYLAPTLAMLAGAELGFRLAPWSAAFGRLAAAGVAGGAALAACAHALKLDEMVRGVSYARGWFEQKGAA
jgi:putative peptidoglycan lipid II flippase